MLLKGGISGILWGCGKGRLEYLPKFGKLGGKAVLQAGRRAAGMAVNCVCAKSS